jgi:hypothetical protein
MKIKLISNIFLIQLFIDTDNIYINYHFNLGFWSLLLIMSRLN